MEYAKSPWSIDIWGNVIDATGTIVSVDGVAIQMGSPDRTTANTKLIAAAPELLEACEFIDSLDPHNDSTTEWNSAFKMVRAAVAKAKGESK